MFQHYLPLQWHQRMMGSIVWWGPSPYWELEMVPCHISSTLLPEIYSKIYHVVIISMTTLFSIISFSMTNLMLFPPHVYVHYLANVISFAMTTLMFFFHFLLSNFYDFCLWSLLCFLWFSPYNFYNFCLWSLWCFNH